MGGGRGYKKTAAWEASPLHPLFAEGYENLVPTVAVSLLPPEEAEWKEGCFVTQ